MKKPSSTSGPAPQKAAPLTEEPTAQGSSALSCNAGKNDIYLRERYLRMEASCQAAMRAHLGNDIVFTKTWAEAAEERELEEEELLEGEVSATVLAIGCYSVRIAECRSLDEPNRTETEISVKYNPGSGTSADVWERLCWDVERMDYLCTAKRNAAIPDEQASLFLFIDTPESREATGEWEEITPDGMVFSLSYGLCPRNRTDAELAAEVYEACCQFCKQIGAVRVYDKSNAEDLLRVFADLYAKALYLPGCFSSPRRRILELLEELGSDEPEENSFHHLFQGGFDLDFSRLEPYAEEDEADGSVDGHLGCDVRDMYSDLSSGMRFYEHGYVEYALREWAESFHVHWRWHIVSAITLLEKIGRRAGGA